MLDIVLKVNSWEHVGEIMLNYLYLDLECVEGKNFVCIDTPLRMNKKLSS